MKRRSVAIPLVNSELVAWIDARDASRVRMYSKWWLYEQQNKHTISRYAYTRDYGTGKQRTLYMHRLILRLAFDDPRQGDHVDHDGLNNRRINLRMGTEQQNRFNQTKRPNARTARFKGVAPINGGKYGWQAKITINYRNRYLGSFPTQEEAAMRYNVAARKFFGGFAHLNKVEMG